MPIAALVSMLLPLLPTIIQGVETIFGPKTGAQKLTSVTDIATQLIGTLQKNGKLPAGAFDPKALESIIETLVQSMNNSGQLPADKPVPPVASVSVPGKNMTISLNFKDGIFQSIG